jgi:hypothetical protein
MKSGLGILITGLAGIAPAMAHTGIAQHPPAGGPSHLLMHAAAVLPMAALSGLLVFIALRPLFRSGKRALTDSKGALEQE